MTLGTNFFCSYLGLIWIVLLTKIPFESGLQALEVEYDLAFSFPFTGFSLFSTSPP